jgi:vacuolar protein sorting-associated protein 54
LELLRELQAEVAESVVRIKSLRRSLAGWSEGVVSNELEILRRRQREYNLLRFRWMVVQMKHIMKGMACCEVMVRQEKAGEALREVEMIELLIAGQQYEMLGSGMLPHV